MISLVLLIYSIHSAIKSNKVYKNIRDQEEQSYQFTMKCIKMEKDKKEMLDAVAKKYGAPFNQNI